MRIGMDVDGVLYKWIPTALYLIETEFGIQVPEITHWDTIKDYLPRESWKWLWKEGLRKGLFRHGNAYRGSFDAMEKLASEHELILITSRPDAAIQDTKDWVHFHRIPYKELHILGSRRQDGKDIPKSSIPCDLYVDDKPENIDDVVAHGHKGLLWTRPWNTSVRGYERIYSWKGLFHYLETLK